ncbi:MAG: DnaA ATPase domain-containing protein [Oscillospiraceae bacterium]|jgi:DNA replication protein DnaC|nr:DnaA/Hda family protein [Christensenellales bacterium]HIR68822.1 ATP-binding protein [Candidatus Pelethousia gallinarum]
MKPSAQLLYTYQRAREQALEECRLRQEAVYARFPRLREITEARKALTYQLGRSLLAQEDPQSTRKAYAANMQALLREERALLKENNIPPAFLEPVWRCDACQDTGYVTGEDGVKRMCACLTQRMLAEQFTQGQVSRRERFETFQEDIFPTPRQRKATCKARDICKDYAERFPGNNPPGLLILGQAGLGKSFLLNCVAVRVLERGFSVLSLPAYDYMQAVLAALRDRQPMPDFHAPDLLILDDLGAEPMLNNITRENLTNLLDARQRQGLATAFSSNFTREQIINEYGERFAFRLLSPRNTLTLELIGENLRLLPLPPLEET